MNTNSCIEVLESRIAPAAVLNFIDLDGDHVKVTISKGFQSDFNNAATFVGGQLTRLDVSAPTFGGEFSGANITFSVTPGASKLGDGRFNVGEIISTGNDLGTVTIPGDLGRILAGDSDGATPGLKTLKVNSLGRLGLITGAADLSSIIKGPMGTLNVKGDLDGASVDIQDIPTGKGSLGALKIGGSLIGRNAAGHGSIFAGGNIGSVTIGRDIVGGSAINCGNIGSGGTIGNITIGGSLLGGSGGDTGEILGIAGIGYVKLGGDMRGGDGSNSGEISSAGPIAGVKIRGSLVGGDGNASGTLRGFLTTVPMGPVKIGGNLVGGSIAGSDSLVKSGYIEADTLASLTIGGSIFAGTDDSSGTLSKCGGVSATRTIGVIKIGGSLVGSVNSLKEVNPVVISAGGLHTVSLTADVAIAKLVVAGNVDHANILAGHGIDLSPSDGDAQIGIVRVGGDWITSNLVAGAGNLGTDDQVGGTGSAADNVNFGDAHDVHTADFNAGVLSRIAKVVISGQVIGTASGSDRYGFVAEQIGSLKVGGVAAFVTSGQDNLVLAETGDVSLHEV